MSTQAIVAFALALAAVFGVVSARRVRRRRAGRILLQIAAAVLLYFCLFPPSAREEFAVGELVVLTPRTTPAQLAALPLAANVIALPDVAAPPGIERAPDLATALRRDAGTRRLRIVGGGLPPRDRDIARGRVATFDAAPLPRGLVELDVPPFVLAGRVWRVEGRVEDVDGGRVELRDPAGAVVSAQPLDATGRFALSASAKGEGTALFALSVLDRDGVRVGEASVPLMVRAGSPLKTLLLAGAPDPELKYLRRWAADAGLELDSRIALSDGLALTEGAFAWSADALRNLDIALVDERAWAALDASHRQELVAAAHDGLGLLLRATGPVPTPVAADWAQLGYRVQAVQAPPPVALQRSFDLADSGAIFTRTALAVDAPDAASLLRADDGSILAWSRNFGRGRVALWLLADSYRLGLGGETAAFGSLWGGAFAALARARGDAAPVLPAAARVNERARFCGIAQASAVEDAKGVRSPLIADIGHCAAYWPETPGWHALLSDSGRWPFYVRAADEAPGLAAAENRRATSALLGTPSSLVTVAGRDRPLPRWPFFLAWLAVVAALWWFERGAGHDGAAQAE